MDEGAQLWTLGFCRANWWRVKNLMDIEDLLQEASICYYIVVNRYPEVTPANRMSLYMTTIRRRVHDLSALDTRYRELFDRAADFDVELEAHGVRKAQLGEAIPTNKRTPSYVHAFLWLISQPMEMMRLRSPYRVRIDGERETTHEYLCRMIRHDPSTTPHLPEAVVDYLQSV